MNKEILKKIVKEAYLEVVKEKAAKEKEDSKVKKVDLDQTKDDKIDTGDAVVAARKEKIAASKGDKKDAAFYAKIKKIVNKRIGTSA